MNQLTDVVFTLNGTQHRVRVGTGERLLDTLRQRLGTASLRESCGIGVCGSCTILVGGRVLSACLLFTVMVDGWEMTTAEGLCDIGGSEVQQAFVENRAYQCSFCIPAMTLAVQSIVSEYPDATDEEVQHLLSGNLCRCGTYSRVIESARAAFNCGATRSGCNPGPISE